MIIFTKHALHRLDDRSFSKELVKKTIENADKVLAGKDKNTLEYHKTFDKQTITAVVAKTANGENLVLSCWIDPPVYGTKDYRKQKRYLEYQKAGFWKRLLMDILSTIGL